MAINVTFNTYSLQDVSFRSRIIQHTDIPDKFIQTEPSARADGLTIVNVKYVKRMVEVEGNLSAASRVALVAKVDEMKKKLTGTSGNLDVDWGSETRRYFATVESLEIPEDFYNIDNVPYKVKFLCADPFGYATASGVVNTTAITNLLKDILFTVSGTIYTNPVVHVTFNTASNVSLLTVSNTNTSEEIIINKPGGSAFQAGDVVIINSRKKQVQINSSGVDYTGRFPTISPDSTTLRVELAATAANYDVVIRYLPTYL